MSSSGVTIKWNATKKKPTKLSSQAAFSKEVVSSESQKLTVLPSQISQASLTANLVSSSSDIVIPLSSQQYNEASKKLEFEPTSFTSQLDQQPRQHGLCIKPKNDQKKVQSPGSPQFVHAKHGDEEQNTQCLEDQAYDSLLHGDKNNGEVPLVPMDFRAEVSKRADDISVDGDAYRRVTVEQIGRAMLRGMGWTPGAGIGKTNPRVVKPIQAEVRPFRKGLGASVHKETRKPKKVIKPGETRSDVTTIINTEHSTTNSKKASQHSSQPTSSHNHHSSQHSLESPSPHHGHKRAHKHSRQSHEHRSRGRSKRSRSPHRSGSKERHKPRHRHK